ncbi:LysR family transcriptional regulator [Niallia circulans]|uniref:LysR family transcriptional regulator n=1 Tax=Niallia circulans TaxID=1397 RepID=A0A553SUL8_NIACI|nr:LysR family transcriptional regulator [Niallia circulans]TRZ40690.1 LysR family transcriptional regulator [Niallia circulans]
MEIKQLITFKTAAEHLNFTYTAKVLNFAQSSVTAQIKALENELETPLFERLGKRLVLTEQGKEFKIYADKMIQLTKEAKNAVSGVDEPAGTLTIGASESQCTYRLPSVLKEFKEQFPRVKVIFKPIYSKEQTRAQLLDGSLDIAYTMDSIQLQDSNLIAQGLIEERLKIVASTKHHLAAAGAIQLIDFQNETLLLTEAGCSYRVILEDLFRQSGISAPNKFEFASVEAIKQCIILDLGIAVLPEMVVKAEIDKGVLKELVCKEIAAPVHTQMVWHKDKYMSLALQSFIQLSCNTFGLK